MLPQSPRKDVAGGLRDFFILFSNHSKKTVKLWKNLYNTALSCHEPNRTVLHAVQPQIRQRAYQDKNGTTRYENQVYIARIA